MTQLSRVPAEQRRELRMDIYLVAESIGKLIKLKQIAVGTIEADARRTAIRSRSTRMTNFIPLWVKFAVALALGLGTMIGWKRIVVTVGEKIGKAT